jgi:hypothetical protein
MITHTMKTFMKHAAERSGNNRKFHTGAFHPRTAFRAGIESVAALVTAVSQLLYPDAAVAKWHFSQENATFRSSNKGTFTVEPL